MEKRQSTLKAPPAGSFYYRRVGTSSIDPVAQIVSIKELRISGTRRAQFEGKEVSFDGKEWTRFSEVARLQSDVVHDVFFSCDSTDYPTVEQIKRRLEARGLYGFLASTDEELRRSPDYNNDLSAALSGSLVVVFVGYNRSYKKAWVVNELAFAVSEGKHRVFYWLDKDPMSRQFKLLRGTIPEILAPDDWRSKIDQLADTVQKLCEVRIARPGATRRFVRLFSRPVWKLVRVTGLGIVQLLAGLVLLIIFAAIGIWYFREPLNRELELFAERFKQLVPIRQTPPPRARPAAEACAVEFSRLPSPPQGFWFEQKEGASVVRSSPGPSLAAPNPVNACCQFITCLKEGKSDPQVDSLVSRMSEDSNLVDRSRLIGIIRVGSLHDATDRLAAATLLCDVANWYAEHEKVDRRMVIVAYITRDSLMMTWPVSDIEELDLSNKIFYWSIDQPSNRDADLKKLRSAVAQRPEWHKPVLENQVILLCGELPTLVLRAQHAETFNNQWQSPIGAHDQPKLDEGDFACQTGPFESDLAQVTAEDPLFRLIYRQVVSERRVTSSPAPGDGDRRFVELDGACSALEGVLKELEVHLRGRQLVLLPFVQ